MNKQMKNTLLLGVSLSPFLLGISTVMAVKGLSAGPALFYDMEKRAGEWQAYAALNLSDPAAAQSVIDTLAPLKESVCRIAALEESEGIVSGSRGKGALSAALVSACVGVSAIADSLGETQARAQARQAKVTARLQEIQRIPEEKNTSVFQRRDLFRDEVVLLRQELSASASENVREKVAAQIAVLSNSVVALDTKEGDFGKLQRGAIASLKSQLNEIESIVNGFLAKTAAPESLEEPAELSSSGAAIWRWWPRLTPQILLAVGVDLAILWMAGFLAVSRATVRELEAKLHGKHD